MKLLIIVFFAVINFSLAQNEKLIFGKIICENNPVSGIQITNLVSEKSAISNVDGVFLILAKADDMLVFTSINYEYKRKFLEQEHIDSNNLIIYLTKKIEQLDEVVVSKFPKLDAVNLRILDKPAKEYSVAERRLKNASELKPNLLMNGLLGLSIPIEPIINAISGRTKSLKSQLEIERNEMLLIKVANLYDDEYYTKKLKIYPSFIKAFQHYLISDLQFVGDLKSKNKIKINFRLVELAQKFNKLQADTK